MPMNYSDAKMLASIRHKFSTYSIEQVKYALADIYATMEYHKNDSQYSYKLQAELDAALERMDALVNHITCPTCKGIGHIKEPSS